MHLEKISRARDTYIGRNEIKSEYANAHDQIGTHAVADIVAIINVAFAVEAASSAESIRYANSLVVQLWRIG